MRKIGICYLIAVVLVLISVFAIAQDLNDLLIENGSYRNIKSIGYQNWFGTIFEEHDYFSLATIDISIKDEAEYKWDKQLGAFVLNSKSGNNLKDSVKLLQIKNNSLSNSIVAYRSKTVVKNFQKERHEITHKQLVFDRLQLRKIKKNEGYLIALQNAVEKQFPVLPRFAQLPLSFSTDKNGYVDYEHKFDMPVSVNSATNIVVSWDSICRRGICGDVLTGKGTFEFLLIGKEQLPFLNVGRGTSIKNQSHIDIELVNFDGSITILTEGKTLYNNGKKWQKKKVILKRTDDVAIESSEKNEKENSDSPDN